MAVASNEFIWNIFLFHILFSRFNASQRFDECARRHLYERHGIDEEEVTIFPFDGKKPILYIP